MSDATLLRIVIAVLGAILLAAIYFYGRPRRPQQGKRTERRPSGRVEPTLGRGMAPAKRLGRIDAITTRLVAGCDRSGNALIDVVHGRDLHEREARAEDATRDERERRADHRGRGGSEKERVYRFY